MTVGVRRVKTGIPGLDGLIGGGFKEGSINLVSGSPGSGKTTFAMQFLMEGLLAGEAAIYITFEERKKKLFNDFLDFGWDLERYERMGQLRFLEYTPEQIKRVITEGGGTMDALVTQMNAKRMVIDSITSFSLLFQSELAKKESSLSLFELINRWNCTAVLTGQAVQHGPDDLSAQIEFEVDGILILHHFKKKGVRQRAIEIIKMRGTKIPEKTMKLTLDSKGLKVDEKTIVSFD